MYRDFLRAMREGRAPEMSLERAIDDQRLMDQVYASLARADTRGIAGRWPSRRGPDGGVSIDAERTLRHHHHRQWRRGRDHGAGAVRDRTPASCCSSAASSCPAKPENWDPAAVWKHLRYRTTERWLEEDGQEFTPYTHYARWREHQVLGQRALSPSQARISEVSAHRRRVARVAHRLRHAGPVLRPCRAALPRARRMRRTIRPSRRAARIRTRRSRTARASPRSSTQLRAQGLHPSPLPLGLIRPGEPDGCILCNTCNSFPCQIDARATPKCAACGPPLRRPNVTLWTDASARRLLTDRRRAQGRRPSKWSATARHVRVEAPLVVVSCGAVNSAALLLRSANEAHPDGLANSSGLVGRRYMAHLATMMQGFHPFTGQRHGVPEDRGDQRLLPGGPGRPYPSATSRRRAARTGSWPSWWETRTRSTCPPGFRSGPTTRGWRAAWTGSRCARTCRIPRTACSSSADGRIRCRYRPNNVAAHERLVKEAMRMLKRLGFWKVMEHSHQDQNTTHQCGTLCFGTDPTRVGAGSVLPHARHRQPLRGRRVVLPLVGGGQSRADDRRPGLACRGPHQGRTT